MFNSKILITIMVSSFFSLHAISYSQHSLERIKERALSKSLIGFAVSRGKTKRLDNFSKKHTLNNLIIITAGTTVITAYEDSGVCKKMWTRLNNRKKKIRARKINVTGTSRVHGKHKRNACREFAMPRVISFTGDAEQRALARGIGKSSITDVLNHGESEFSEKYHAFVCSHNDIEVVISSQGKVLTARRIPTE